ncbi:MAG: hypothetical protein SGJ10_08270 [Bacteroidota bacterium]|nr:hypothetical protein [Bacteroidota bacterium]
MDNFENSIRHKLDDAELTPPNDMWSRVEAQLPQDRKRRGLMWMMWLLPFCIIGGGIVLYYNSDDGKVKLAQTIVTANNINTKSTNNGNITAELNLNSSKAPVSTQIPISNMGHSAQPFQNIMAHNPNIPHTSSIDLDYLDHIKSMMHFSSNIKQEAPSKLKVKPYLVPPDKLPNNKNEPISNSYDKPCRFVFESVNNIYLSSRVLKANSVATTDQKDYVKLRNSIEYGNVNFSGGVAFKYCVKKNFMVGTGIRFTNYSEDLIYNKRDVTVAFEAPPIGIDELVKKKYPYTFTKQTDSIYAGPNYYGGTNYYFFREVPLTFGYYHYGEKHNFYVEPAISYCRISAIKTSLLDLDHVGFTTVNQIDGYEGVSHIFNSSIRVGGGYNFTKSVSFNYGLYASKAITPLVNYGYAKQLPYTCGITLGIEKRL